MERNEYQRQKLEKRRAERKHREAFMAIIQEKLASRDITLETKWRDFVKAHLKDHPAYHDLVG